MTKLQELVLRWRSHHDHDAAKELIDRCYPQVIRIVRNHLPFRMDEEDLAQEVFSRIFASLPQYNVQLPLENWISRVAINVCRDHLRRRACRPELRWTDLRESEQREFEAVREASSPSADAVAADARELLHKVLQTLPADDRIVLTLLHVEEKSAEEIATLTGWSRVLVKVRAFRARARLKKAIEALELPPGK